MVEFRRNLDQIKDETRHEPARTVHDQTLQERQERFEPSDTGCREITKDDGGNRIQLLKKNAAIADPICTSIEPDGSELFDLQSRVSVSRSARDVRIWTASISPRLPFPK